MRVLETKILLLMLPLPAIAELQNSMPQLLTHTVMRFATAEAEASADKLYQTLVECMARVLLALHTTGMDDVMMSHYVPFTISALQHRFGAMMSSTTTLLLS